MIQTTLSIIIYYSFNNAISSTNYLNSTTSDLRSKMQKIKNPQNWYYFKIKKTKFYWWYNLLIQNNNRWRFWDGPLKDEVQYYNYDFKISPLGPEILNVKVD